VPTDLFRLQGQWSTSPQDGGLLRSGAAPIGPTPVNECVTLDEKTLDCIQLASDGPQSVAFGGVARANVVVIQADKKIDALLTSADGTAQVVPVDGTFVLITRTVPVTAISLTRVPATLTNVNVFIGEKA